VQNELGRWVSAPTGIKPSRWRARTKFRDADGELRDVERFAPTKARAEANLRSALKDRKAPANGDVMRADMSLVAAGTHWLEQVKRPDSKLSDNTRDQYEAAFGRYVKGSRIAGLSLREANRVPVLETYLQGVADAHGTGAAKTARSVVSSVIGLAVRYKVLDHNAMRDVRPAQASVAKTVQRDTTRALTRAERDHVLAVADDHEGAQYADVADLLWFMAGTGVRISEALGQRWHDVDLDAGTVFVRGTKTDASQRRLSLPGWLTERLTTRAGELGTDGLVFRSPGTSDADKVRDRRNVARVFRAVLDEAGFPWATPHTFRRTVATLLDEAGLPIALAANQLGHANPAMTARVYLGRKGDMSAAGAVL
jgi:integrase